MKKIGSLRERKRRGGEVREYIQPRLELVGKHLPATWKPGDEVEITPTADAVLIQRTKKRRST